MAIEDLGISLLDRQERLTEEARLRSEERRQKARRAKRRQELIGAGIQGGVKIGNAILSERSDNFINKEWDMASRAKYKATVSARDDTQALWTNIRNTHDSSADWKLDQLKEDAFEYYKRIEPNWDGKLNPEAARKLKEEAEKWGTNFDMQHQKSFEIEDYDKYAEGLQKKFGRPKDVGSWITRGIVDRFGGMSLAEGRASRKEALQKEIEGFDEKYGSFYDSVAERTGSSEDALEIVRTYAANAREEVINFKVESDGFVYQLKRGTDGKTTYTKTDQWVGKGATLQNFGDQNSGVMALSQNKDGSWNQTIVQDPKDRLPSADERKEAVNESIRQLYASPDYSNLGSDLERYNKLRKENEPLFLKGITGNSPLLKQFYDNQTTTLTNAGISGGRTVLTSAIKAQFKTLQTADGNFASDSPIILALEKAGFKDKNSQQAQLELMRRFGQDGREDDSGNYTIQVTQDVVDIIKKDKSRKINHVSLIADAMVERSKHLIELKDSAPGWFRDDLIVYQGSRTDQEVDELRQTNTIKRAKAVVRMNEKETVKFGEASLERVVSGFEEALKKSPQEATKYIEDIKSGYAEKAKRDNITATLELPDELRNFEKNIAEEKAKKMDDKIKKAKDESRLDALEYAAAYSNDYKDYERKVLATLPPKIQNSILQEAKRQGKLERNWENVKGSFKKHYELDKAIKNLNERQKRLFDSLRNDQVDREEAYEIAVKG